MSITPDQIKIKLEESETESQSHAPSRPPLVYASKRRLDPKRMRDYHDKAVQRKLEKELGFMNKETLKHRRKTI